MASGILWRRDMRPLTTVAVINKRCPTACVTKLVATLQICQPLRKKEC